MRAPSGSTTVPATLPRAGSAPAGSATARRIAKRLGAVRLVPVMRSNSLLGEGADRRRERACVRRGGSPWRLKHCLLFSAESLPRQPWVGLLARRVGLDAPAVASPSPALRPSGTRSDAPSLTVAEPRRTCTGLPCHAPHGHPRQGDAITRSAGCPLQTAAAYREPRASYPPPVGRPGPGRLVAERTAGAAVGGKMVLR